jgi:hypothetical protein
MFPCSSAGRDCSSTSAWLASSLSRSAVISCPFGEHLDGAAPIWRCCAPRPTGTCCGLNHPAKGLLIGVRKRFIEFPHFQHGGLLEGPGLIGDGNRHFVAQRTGIWPVAASRRRRRTRRPGLSCRKPPRRHERGSSDLNSLIDGTRGLGRGVARNATWEGELARGPGHADFVPRDNPAETGVIQFEPGTRAQTVGRPPVDIELVQLCVTGRQWDGSRKSRGGELCHALHNGGSSALSNRAQQSLAEVTNVPASGVLARWLTWR